MKLEKTSGILGGIEAIVAIFMLFAVTRLAPVCSGMLDLVSGKQVHMKCYYTGVVLVYLAVLFIVSAVLLVAKNQKLVSSIMTVAIAICVFAILKDNFGIGICMNPEMACHATAPYAKICATVELLLGLASVALSLKKEQ